MANIRRSKSSIPVFLFFTITARRISGVDVLAQVDGFIWIFGRWHMDAIVKGYHSGLFAGRNSHCCLPLFNADDVWKASCLTSRDGWIISIFLAGGWLYSDSPTNRVLPETDAKKRNARFVKYIFPYTGGKKPDSQLPNRASMQFSFYRGCCYLFRFFALRGANIFCLFVADSAVNGLSRRLAGRSRSLPPSWCPNPPHAWHRNCCRKVHNLAF